MLHPSGCVCRREHQSMLVSAKGTRFFGGSCFNGRSHCLSGALLVFALWPNPRLGSIGIALNGGISRKPRQTDLGVDVFVAAFGVRDFGPRLANQSNVEQDVSCYFLWRAPRFADYGLRRRGIGRAERWCIQR